MSDHQKLALILTAVAIIAAIVYPPPSWLVWVVAIVITWKAWLWLCRHHPYVAIFVFGFLRGLLGGRRRR